MLTICDNMIKLTCQKALNTVRHLTHHHNTTFGAILMLHRVDTPNPDGIWYNQHLKMSSKAINEMANYARQNKCKFVSIDEMVEAIHKEKKARRWITITLDDGYRDNYTNGVSVFRQQNIPYTIYVCTKIVEGEMLYWWEILEQMVLNHEIITLSDGRSFDCSTKEAKEQTFLDIREIILQLPQKGMPDSINKMFLNYNIDYDIGKKDLGLTWEQIQELNKDPFVTIGNHTYSHCAFTNCNDEEINEDIKLAAQSMMHHIGLSMQHFAFPFGEVNAVSQHDVELVKQLNFKSSATTKDGLISYDTDPLELPRLFVTEKNWKHVINRIITNC